VVAIVASPPLAASGWGLSVATQLARGWSAARPGVVVVDTDLERPRLHRALGLDNVVGLAEVLRGDGALAEATSAVDGDRLFCVPAGNVAQEPAHFLFDAKRWSRFCRAFAQAGVTVVAYAPKGIPWLEDVLAAATDVVELRERHRPLHRPPSRAPVRAVLGPRPLAGAPASDTSEESGEVTGAVHTPETPDDAGPARVQVPEGGVPFPWMGPEPGKSLPRKARWWRKWRRGSGGERRPWVTAELVIVAAVFVAAVFVYAGVIGIRTSLEDPTGSPDESAIPADARSSRP
jgi:hypothetical protein